MATMDQVLATGHTHLRGRLEKTERQGECPIILRLTGPESGGAPTGHPTPVIFGLTKEDARVLGDFLWTALAEMPEPSEDVRQSPS